MSAPQPQWSTLLEAALAAPHLERMDQTPANLGDDNEDDAENEDDVESQSENTSNDVANADLGQGGGAMTLGLLLEEVFKEKAFQGLIPVPSQYDKITIAVDTEWIKCACGSLKFGLRFEDSSSSSTPAAICLTWDLFGGTDTDRSHMGDTFFWEAVQRAVPAVTSQQWTEYVQENDLLVVEEKEEGDEEEYDDDEEEECSPLAAYPISSNPSYS